MKRLGLVLLGTLGALVLSAQVAGITGFPSAGFSQAAADLLYWPLAGGPITVAADMDVTLSGGVNGFSLDGATFSVDATNNRVGVGRTDPPATLSVGPSTGLTGSSVVTLAYVGENTASTRLVRVENAVTTVDLIASSGNQGYVGTVDAAPFSLMTEGAERLFVSATGNVGIGDFSPAAMLTVGDGDLFQVTSAGAMTAASIKNSGTEWVNAGTGAFFYTNTSTHNLTMNGSGTLIKIAATATLYRTETNCTDSAGAAACTAAPGGSVVIDAGATTVVVSTTAVTANSQVFVMEDESLGTRLGVTCNTAGNRNYTISARTAATSFTIKSSGAVVTNPACLSYFIIN